MLSIKAQFDIKSSVLVRALGISVVPVHRQNSIRLKLHLLLTVTGKVYTWFSGVLSATRITVDTPFSDLL